MLRLFPYFLIFSNFFTYAIADVAPGLMTIKLMAIVLAIISFLFLVVETPKVPPFVRCKMLIATITVLFVTILYYFTGQVYSSYPSYMKNVYDGYFLTIIGQVFPIILVAMVFAQMDVELDKAKKMAPYIALLFTAVSIKTALNPSDITSGGYAIDENGMNYQNVSYMAAYASSLNFFYLLNFKRINWGWLFRRKITCLFMCVVIVLNLLTTLIAGGRGGMLTVIVQFVVFYYFFTKHNFEHVNYGKHFFVFVFVVVVIAAFVVSVANSISIESSGFTRIIAFIYEGADAGRGDIRRQAFRSFAESPILGHGIGSSIFEVGTKGIHCHNYFLDALVDTGIIGACFFVFLIIYILKKAYKMANKNVTDYLWLIILLDGVIMAMFSGYYLSHLPIYWSLGFLVSKK